MSYKIKSLHNGSFIAADLLFLAVLEKVAANSRIHTEDMFIQHGTTSCLLHSIAVAYYSYRIAKFLKGWFTDHKSLIRGALLHDYFLYDWHFPGHRLHGFRHPKMALMNAKHDFNLNPIEEDIVKNHMFPLTLTPPKCRETFLVCAVDKACSIYETFSSYPYSKRQIRDICENIIISTQKERCEVK